ncbi:alpha/beta fold hydrolase [Alteromonas genovensis]|uniref:alpha/beta fold hydrolase n=1 Tax=Alteromonas genovensis TaxID=471225 RepID=UPI002FDF3F6A
MYLETDIIKRNNVRFFGNGEVTLLLAHGFGCDQRMWDHLIPYLENDYKIVLFDYVGCGQSDLSAFDKKRYSQLSGYAKDVEEICDALSLSNVIFIGHSVSSTIGMHAAIERPDLISKLIMICPSPCFLNLPPDYMGGFEKDDLEELINLMDKNYLGWASYFAPLVVGEGHDESVKQEMEDSFCSTDPSYAKPFAKATFFADDRYLMPKLGTPTLILQSQDDSLASVEVGRYMNKAIEHSKLIVLEAKGHCLHMTTPEQVACAIGEFLG